MTDISAQELADMRAIADDFFPDTCTIQTPTQTVDVLGGQVLTFANTYTNVACRLDPEGRGSETIVNLALEGKSAWMLNIPYDQDIDITYKVVHDSLEYDIVRVNDTHSYSTIRRALLARVNDG